MKKSVCFWFGCALLLIACSRQASAPQAELPAASLSGTVALSEPDTLDEQTVLELSLTDVSAEDGSVEVAKKQFQPAHYPAEFSLPYDSSAIDARHRYTISARVLRDAQPQWVTDTAYPVITLGNPLRIDVQLVRSGADAQRPTPNSDAPTAIEGELRGSEGLATYRAYFQNSQLARIEENQNKKQASYEYAGARLRHYAATDTASKTRLELHFDERGKLISAAQLNGGRAATIDSGAIDAARNRAALLRSHALATQEIKQHERAGHPLNPS